MRPQSAAFLEKAQELLEHSEKMLAIGLSEGAGRTAYLAGFHAAQALIFETHARVFKTHRAFRANSGGWSKTIPALTASFARFLAGPISSRPSPITKPAPTRM